MWMHYLKCGKSMIVFLLSGWRKSQTLWWGKTNAVAASFSSRWKQLGSGLGNTWPSRERFCKEDTLLQNNSLSIPEVSTISHPLPKTTLIVPCFFPWLHRFQATECWVVLLKIACLLLPISIAWPTWVLSPGYVEKPASPAYFCFLHYSASGNALLVFSNSNRTLPWNMFGLLQSTEYSSSETE